MGRKRTAVACVASAAALAACLGRGPSESSTQQAIDMAGPSGFVWTNGTGSYTFQPTPIHATSAPITLQFTPLDINDDYYLLAPITATSQCPDFPISGPPPVGGGLNGAGTGTGFGTGSAEVFYATDGSCTTHGSAFPCDYTFSAMFSPNTTGAEACTYYFPYMDSNGSVSGQIDLDLYGTGSAGSGMDLVASQNTLNFTVTPNSSSTLDVTITNEGAAGSMTTSIISGDTTHYSWSPMSPYPLGSGSSVTLMVTCMANSTPGTFGATLGVAPTSGSGTGSSVALSCTVENTTLMFSPSTVQFPVTLVGTPATNQTVDISQSGAGGAVNVTLDPTATGNGVAIVGGSNYNFTPGTPAVVTLSWSPGQPIEGPLGTLNVTGAGTGSVGIDGTAGTALVTTVPTSIDFGTVCVGNSTAPVMLDVFNLGAADIDLEGASVTNAPPFSVQSPGKVTLVRNRGNDQMIPVSVAPTAAGSSSGNVMLPLQVGSPLSVSVQAMAISSGLTAAPASLDFGSTPQGMVTAGQSVEIANCGSGTLTISSATVAGTGSTKSSEFAIVLQPTTMTIPMAGSASYTLAMDPTSPGAKQATFTVAFSDGESVNVPLAGSATGEVSPGADRQTFYACATSNGATAWPVLAALGCLLAWRRRRD